jgi:adenine deaminase
MTIIEASLGKTPVDLLVTNVQLANVLTGEIYPADIAVYGAKIVAVEPPGTQPQRKAGQVLDGGGQLLVPGLIDSHLHIESSLVTPAPFAEAVLRRGITTVAEDPHEIANATGLPGVKHFLEASRDLPLTILFLASTCVPAAKGLEHCRGELGPEEIRKMLGWEGVIGLAEVMDARAVVDEDPHMSAILQAGRDAGGVIEGHNPMLTGRELQAYITAGVDSDHTLASPSRYIEKLRLGVTVQLQERYMNREVIEAIKALPQPLPSLCLVTDDVAPDYLESYGHLDHVLKQAIELGLPPMQALQAATINPARRLRLFDRGAIAPGRRADLVLVDSLPSFNVSTTISGGEIVVENGQTLWRVPPNQPELDPLRNSLDLSPLSVEDFRINFPGDGSQAEVRVIISHPHGTTTEEGRAVVQLKDGQPQIDETDLALIGVFARGEIGQSLGFIQGLGLQKGALATTHAHDSHNLMVIGRDDQSMATAANAVIGMEGGMAVSVDNEVLARVPLPIAGIISDSPMPAVAYQWGRLTGVLADLGVKHPFLLMRLTTFTLPVSTGLRITDMGYVRAAERELVPLLVG